MPAAVSPSQAGNWEETVDFVDARDHVVRCGPRGRAWSAGLYYRVAATVLHNGDGRVLVYRRTPAAEILPSYYDVLIGGAVRSGESYRTAARRELAEELGVHLPVREVYRVSTDTQLGPCHLAVHLAVLNGTVRPAPDEIAQHSLLPIEQVLADPPPPFDPEGLTALERLFT